MNRKRIPAKAIKQAHMPVIAGYSGKLLTVDYHQLTNTNVIHMKAQSIIIDDEELILAPARSRPIVVSFIFEDRVITLAELTATPESTIRFNGNTVPFQALVLSDLDLIIGKRLKCVDVRQAINEVAFAAPNGGIRYRRPVVYQFEELN